MNQVKTVEKTSEEKRGDRRERLREFQSQLLERMQVARSSEATSTNQLGVMIGDTRYLLNLKESGEIVSLGQITQVPLTRDWYLGLLNVRGNLIGVIDIQRFQGRSSVEATADCRVVAFSAGLAFNAGLLVTKVLGLRNVAEMTAQQASEPSAWKQQSYLDSNNQSWVELNLAQLIQDSDFLHIGL